MGIFAMLLLSHALLAQEYVVVKGFVRDEYRVPIEGAEISVNNTDPVRSDANGEFSVRLPQANAMPHRIMVNKEGYTGNLNWGLITSEDGSGVSIKIKLVRDSNFQGKVVDNLKGVAVPRAMVRLAGDVSGGPVQTDEDGDFYLKLPKKATAQTKIFINGEEVPKAEIRFDAQTQYAHITFSDARRNSTIIQIDPKSEEVKAEKIFYRVDVYNQLDQLLPAIVFLIDGKQYVTDSLGGFQLEMPLPKANRFLPKTGFSLMRVERDDLEKRVKVVLKEPMKDTPVEIEPLPIDKSEYTEKLKAIALGIEQDQILLATRGMELRREIARLAAKLSQERNLSLEKKEEIATAIQKLRETLDKNDEEYERSKDRTREILGKMQQDLDIVADQNREIEAKARQQLIIFLLVTVGLIGLLLIFFFISDKMRRQRNELDAIRQDLEAKVEEIRQKNDQILSQTDKLKAMNHTISAKNQKITDSLQYAQAMQMAILPPTEAIAAAFPAYLLLYRSKELVSGDFYWFSETQLPDGSMKRLIGVIDCTGHGLPGGFLSMIGHALLSEIVNVKGIHDTAEILKQLNDGIQAAFHQNETLAEEGMDVCICSIEPAGKHTKVLFSGARRPLIYVKANTKETVYVKGDPRSIAGMVPSSAQREFSKTEILLNKGDSLFLTSDGFAKQGTQERGKVGVQQLLDLIGNHANHSMPEMKEAMEQLLKDYEIEDSQRDDVLVLGVRI